MSAEEFTTSKQQYQREIETEFADDEHTDEEDGDTDDKPTKEEDDDDKQEEHEKCSKENKAEAKGITPPI